MKTTHPLDTLSPASLAGRIDVSTGRIDPAERMPCRTGVAASFRH